MGQASNSINVPVATTPKFGLGGSRIMRFLPAILPLLGALILVATRKKLGPDSVPADGTLIVIAVLCYIAAAAALLTNFWAPIKALERFGLIVGSLGVFFNLSSWLVRWVTSGERENWIRMTNQITGEYHSWWFFSYIPFANLYDLSVAFAFGAGFGTMLVSSRPKGRLAGALSMPLIALILIFAIFMGNEFMNLPPVLDSYWRPIHVGVASMSYGIALVSFTLAVLYLMKDGLRIESMAIAVCSFLLAGFILFSNAFSFFSASYKLTPVIAGPNGVLAIRPLQVIVPGVGILVTISMLMLFAVVVCFVYYTVKNNEQAKRIGHLLLKASLIPQAIGLGVLFYQMRTMVGLGSRVPDGQLPALGKFLAASSADQMTITQLVDGARNWLGQNSSLLTFNSRSNPVELAALLTALVATAFVVLFSVKTDRIRESLPSKERLDSLTYRFVGAAFAGLAILLVTGAVWANESWGRYWGWDAKETGALVAWLAYAGYLHTRIAHGWSGRRSAYFALIGFLLVIFTYLGVSFLLPGLHSYAGGLE